MLYGIFFYIIFFLKYSIIILDGLILVYIAIRTITYVYRTFLRVQTDATKVDRDDTDVIP
jgi:hypothetical protein